MGRRRMPWAQSVHLSGDVLNLFLHLTRRANQRHIFIIADIVKLAPPSRPRAFSFAAMLSAESFKLSNLLHRILCNLLTGRKTFDTSGKSPADYHHRENRAEPGRRNPPRAFSIEIYESDGGRKSRRLISQRLSLEASSARRRPNHYNHH